MKKILLFLLAVMCAINVQAANIKKIVFFGDSLTDNGNIYGFLFHVIPKSPPYFEGRFSNGETWAENVSKYYYNKKNTDFSIYAVGGATAVFHMPTTKFISPTFLEAEVDKYLLDSIFRDRSNILFAIWIGGNDYLFDAGANPDKSTTNVVDKIHSVMEKLYANGARNFLILNLPDLSKVPEVIQNGNTVQLQAMTMLHNQKLAAALEEIESKHKDVIITKIDTSKFFADVIDNTGDFNKRFNVNIKNVTEACWSGGYWLNQSLSSQQLARDIQQTIANNNISVPKDFSAEAMSEFILNTPELADTYKMTQSLALGNSPCSNPDEYLFWDHIHPTAIAHQVLARIVIDELNKKYS